MNDIHFIYTSTPTPSVGVGVGVGVTCFLGDQMVQMANGSLTRIDCVIPGDKVKGRWGVNTVRGIEKPRLGQRSMYLVNDEFYNTGDHPMWTMEGFGVIDPEYFKEHTFECWCKIYGEHEEWQECYRPMKPENAIQVIEGTMAATVSGFTRVETVVAEEMDPATQLYSLALDGDRTMYIDGYCVSGWADHRKFDYDSRVGT